MRTDAIAYSLRQAGIQVPPIQEKLAREPESLYGFDVAAEEAIATRERVRRATEQTGLYPVLVADEHGFLAEQRDFPAPSEVVAQADSPGAARWLSKVTSRVRESPRGEWPSKPPPPLEFSVPFERLTRKPRTDLFIILLPTCKPWEAAAYIQFETVNYDIAPHLHVAMHKYFFERYSAELVACSYDLLEFSVGQPPTLREAALDLAIQHYGYCNDRVLQGSNTVEALAAELLNARIWFFWWD